MMNRFRTLFTVAAVPAALALAPADGHAQEPFTWENATELSWVSTGGNASSSSLGLKASLIGSGEPSRLKIEAGGIRAKTSLVSRRATGSMESPTIDVTTVSQLTAENYFLRARYDRGGEHNYVFGGGGWDRNTFAGIQNRYALVAGVGRMIVDGDAGRFKADVGATYTVQKDVDPAPGADDGFGGARLTVEARRVLTATTTYQAELVVDQNLEDTDDLRADWINSLSVSLSERLALKTSLQILYDKQPSLLSVPFFDAGGTQTGTVLTPGDKIDNILTLTLVIKL